MPCFNAGPWVAGALESVANQSHPVHEILVVDDGSTDDSLDRIRSCGVPVRLLQTQRANAAGARNAGIEAATGDWIAFLDADNVWYPFHLAEAARLLDGSSDSAFMSFNGRSPEPTREVSARVASPLDEPTSGLTGEVFLKWRLARSYGFPTSGMVLARNVVQELGGFDLTQVRRHDFELFMRVIHGRTWSFHPGPTWYQRPPRAGDLSFDRVKTRYFACRALLKNEERYAGALMRELIHREARRALSAAVLEGGADDIERARELVWPRLPAREKLFFAFAFRWPSLARSLLRRRREVGTAVTPA